MKEDYMLGDQLTGHPVLGYLKIKTQTKEDRGSSKESFIKIMFIKIKGYLWK